MVLGNSAGGRCQSNGADHSDEDYCEGKEIRNKIFQIRSLTVFTTADSNLNLADA